MDSLGQQFWSVITMFGIFASYTVCVIICNTEDNLVERNQQINRHRQQQQQQQPVVPQPVVPQPVVPQPVVRLAQEPVDIENHDVISRTPTPESIYEYNNITFKALEDLGSSEWSVCSICLEPMCKEQIIQMLSCGHYYHNECLSNWFIKKKIDLCCPMCNKKLESVSIV
jgi:hypothetical protein